MSDPGSKLTPSQGRPVVRHRLMPSVVTFLVAAGAVYVTAYLAIGIIQHVVMPILAVLVGGYLATVVFRHTGNDQGRGGDARPGNGV